MRGVVRERRGVAQKDGFLTIMGHFVDKSGLTLWELKMRSGPWPSPRQGSLVTRREVMSRKLLPERAYYAVGRGPPEEPSAAHAAASADVRLTTGTSLLIILLSSLGLWAMIWAVVVSLA